MAEAVARDTKQSVKRRYCDETLHTNSSFTTTSAANTIAMGEGNKSEAAPAANA